MTLVFESVLIFLLVVIWGALTKLNEHIGVLRRIAEARAREGA